MIITGREILKNKDLEKFLLKNDARVMSITWRDGSVTSGLGRNIVIEKVNGEIAVTEMLWSEPITKKMTIEIELR